YERPHRAHPRRHRRDAGRRRGPVPRHGAGGSDGLAGRPRLRLRAALALAHDPGDERRRGAGPRRAVCRRARLSAMAPRSVAAGVLAALAAGGVLALAGARDGADAVWAAGIVLALIPLTLTIARTLRSGRAGVDVI